ncbi:NrdH-redoxin [Soehngenia saccharolytica]|nr:NrdH-redoxin [Soehngenia saccharolytica]
MQNLKLYYMKGCPFCKKVIQFMERNNIEVEMVDIQADPKNEEELIKLGGKDQVPMLLIDGKPLYESNDIIQWLKDNYKQSEQ